MFGDSWTQQRFQQQWNNMEAGLGSVTQPSDKHRWMEGAHQPSSAFNFSAFILRYF